MCDAAVYLRHFKARPKSGWFASFNNSVNQKIFIIKSKKLFHYTVQKWGSMKKRISWQRATFWHSSIPEEEPAMANDNNIDDLRQNISFQKHCLNNNWNNKNSFAYKKIVWVLKNVFWKILIYHFSQYYEVSPARLEVIPPSPDLGGPWHWPSAASTNQSQLSVVTSNQSQPSIVTTDQSEGSIERRQLAKQASLPLPSSRRLLRRGHSLARRYTTVGGKWFLSYYLSLPHTLTKDLLWVTADSSKGTQKITPLQTLQ